MSDTQALNLLRELWRLKFLGHVTILDVARYRCDSIDVLNVLGKVKELLSRTSRTLDNRGSSGSTQDPKPFKLHPKWKRGSTDTEVVSDEPRHDQLLGAADTVHYGGYLVAESVPPSLVPLIAAAPAAVYLLSVIQSADKDCVLDGLPRAVPPFIRGRIDEILTPEVLAAIETQEEKKP